MADNEEKKPNPLEQYQNLVTATSVAANLIGPHDLPKILSAISHAEAVGPIQDPTLWREKSGPMAEDKELLEAALPLWELAQKRNRILQERAAEAEKKADKPKP